MQEALVKTWKNIRMAIPMTVGILMIISILNPILKNYYARIFTGNYFIDPFIGALAGSITFGIPITSYITGGELLKSGVSLLAVTAFVYAWTTVGVVMLPLEMSFLGKRFAIVRNSLNFVFSILVAILTMLTLNLFK